MKTLSIKTKASPLEDLGTAIGVGIIAGLAGTLAITISQMIEMKITRRKPSNVPAEAVSKVLDVKPTEESQKEKVSNEVHWTYGTSWGMVRGLLALSGLHGWQATCAHFLAVWGTEQVMLPSLKLSPPIHKEAPKTVGIDIIHHAVYALVTGFIYDSIKSKEIKRVRIKSLWK